MTIRSLQHFAFTVPKPDVGRRFYEAFGLEARADGDAVVLRCQGRDQDQVVLVPGAPKRLRHLSFVTHADELVALKGRLEANRVRLLDSPPVRGGEGLWFQDPDGLLLNVRVAEAAPWAASPEWRINSPGHVVRVAARGCPPRDSAVRPRRLGHVLLFTSDLDRQHAFYVDVLGFRLSAFGPLPGRRIFPAHVGRQRSSRARLLREPRARFPPREFRGGQPRRDRRRRQADAG